MKMHMIGDIIRDRKEGSGSHFHASARTCGPRGGRTSAPSGAGGPAWTRKPARPRGGKLTRRGCSKFSAGTLRLHPLQPSSREGKRPGDRSDKGPAERNSPDGGPDTGHRLTAIRKQAFMPIIPECPVAGSTWGMGITIAYRRSTHMHMRSGLSAGVRGNRLGGGTNECAEL